jgi:phosphatidylserine decarboxylase
MFERAGKVHQYIERNSKQIKTESLICDRIINFMYSSSKERMPWLLGALTSSRISSLLGYLNYDRPMKLSFSGTKKFTRKLGIDLSECVDSPEILDTHRKLFERKIRYWEVRPLPDEHSCVVSPADSKMLAGSFSRHNMLFIKEKFFDLRELLSDRSLWDHRTRWIDEFKNGDFAIFRLTPEKYHYNHTPVAGKVLDIYEITGRYHSCNPGAVIEVASPYSKNKRTVTVLDTEVRGGTGVGLVAMVEIVALMIGDIVQCYSDDRYDNPSKIKPGMFLKRGRPKSLFRPGSSVDILIFQKDRIRFSNDILQNLHHPTALSRFSAGFGKPLVETEVAVRSKVMERKERI